MLKNFSKILAQLGLVMLLLAAFFLWPRGEFDFAAIELQIPAGGTTVAYTSPEIEAAEFNALFVRFDTVGTGAAEFAVRFPPSEQWQALAPEHEDELALSGQFSGFTTLSLANRYQFQIELKGEPGFAIQKFQLETRDTNRRSLLEQILSLIPTARAQLTDLGVISRADWGADPSLLLWRKVPASSGAEDPVWTKRGQQCEDLQKNYPTEFRSDGREITTNASGERVAWPQTYSPKIEKIVLHHTDSKDRDLNGDDVYDADDSAALVRAIYYRHAIFNGWGDVGYNYLIDPFGNIYEGRTGGERVIGAHVYCANTGTIGIAFLGDFTENLPTDAAVAAVSELVGELSNLYDLDPLAESLWHGKQTSAVVGHQDYGATACPARIEELLPEIRVAAKTYQRNNRVSDAAYAYQLTYSNSPLQLAALSKNKIEIALKNIGQEAWPEGSTFRVARGSRGTNRLGAMLGDGGDAVATLNKPVFPGSTVKLEIPVAAKMKAGRYRFAITPNFGDKRGEQFYLVVNVVAPELSYEFVSAKHPPQPFEPGSDGLAWVQLKNTSNFTWQARGENRVYLGMLPADATKNYFGESKELAVLDVDTPPGQTARFILNLRAPEKAGRYYLKFAPAVDNFGYLPDYGMQFHITVRSSGISTVESRTSVRLAAGLIDAPNKVTLARGETTEITIAYKNTGNLSWKNSGENSVKLGTYQPKDRKSGVYDASWQAATRPAVLTETEVAPGEVGHFTFRIAKKNVGREDEYFAPVMEAVGWMTQQPVKIMVLEGRQQAVSSNKEVLDNEQRAGSIIARPESFANVESAPPVKTQIQSEAVIPANYASSDKGPLIRIRLSFSNSKVGIGGGPLVLKNSAAKVIFDGAFVDFIKAKLKEGEYYRVEPRGSTILEVANWAHQPGWSEIINDNRFRGALEVWKLNGELVVINELSLEDYIRGVAEPLPSDPWEKAQLLAVLARSYALYYTDPAHRKFPGQPYDGSDDPAEFQRYLGYSYELRGQMPQAAEATRGLVATYAGKVVKTPYFTSSTGRTKTAAEARWNAEDFKFTKSVSDPWSCGLNSKAIGTSFACPERAAGHGVGVSGRGATGLALEGRTFREIITYFFDGLEVAKVY
jgi:hypothetical protein